jgi:hypothetical protein
MEQLKEESGEYNPNGKRKDRFQNLSCIIGAKWRDLPFTDPELLAECQEMAWLDRIRYDQELRLWEQSKPKAMEDEEQNEEMENCETAEENFESGLSDREHNAAISAEQYLSIVGHSGLDIDFFQGSSQQPHQNYNGLIGSSTDSLPVDGTNILPCEQSHNGQPNEWSEFLHCFMADNNHLVDEMLPSEPYPVQNHLDDMSVAPSTLIHAFHSSDDCLVKSTTNSLQVDCTSFSNSGILSREQSYNGHPEHWFLQHMPGLNQHVDDMFFSELPLVRHDWDNMSKATATLTHTFHPSSVAATHAASDMTHTDGSASLAVPSTYHCIQPNTNSLHTEFPGGDMIPWEQSSIVALTNCS